ncbi:MAG: hypothetical protein NC040_04250 [Muribaculaceae bacterium]|nr:hypothetical protein [Alistipes senegalensis]MCM1473244.1 hypothetical protein [Muribaculaceae bacterium]
MSLDLYIETKITEKKTGRLISRDYDFFEDNYIEICYWCTWSFEYIRDGLIEIANKYSGQKYTSKDFEIPFPENALHEIYGYLLENSFVPESEYKWSDSMAREMSNVENAWKLRRFIWGLECIKHTNTFILNEIRKCIPDENDWKNLNENPQAFEWKFRISNSY